MRTKRTLLAVLLVGVAVNLLAGCDNLTREHYDMITVNVDREADVAKMIGDPDSKLPGQWHYERPDKHLNVIIDFSDDGVVTRKQWIDAMSETWEDTKQPGDEPRYESTEIHRSNQ